MSEEQIKESKIEAVWYDVVTRQFMAGLMIKYGEEEVKSAIESLVYERIEQLKKEHHMTGLKEMINEDERL